MYPVFFSLSLSLLPACRPLLSAASAFCSRVRPPACGDEPTTQDYRVARGGHRNVR